MHPESLSNEHCTAEFGRQSVTNRNIVNFLPEASRLTFKYQFNSVYFIFSTRSKILKNILEFRPIKLCWSYFYNFSSFSAIWSGYATNLFVVQEISKMLSKEDKI